VDDPAALGGGSPVIRPADAGGAPLTPSAPRAYSEPRSYAEVAPRPRREHREPESQDLALREVVAFIARGLVDHPDAVEVEILEPGEDAAFELHVHPDDLGHVIGKQGRTARSLRLALGAAAARMGRRASLEIAD
jgi:predicted RNA-binding protein YlqC (UPF0109 family)